MSNEPTTKPDNGGPCYPGSFPCYYKLELQVGSGGDYLAIPVQPAGKAMPTQPGAPLVAIIAKDLMAGMYANSRHIQNAHDIGLGPQEFREACANGAVNAAELLIAELRKRGHL